MIEPRNDPPSHGMMATDAMSEASVPSPVARALSPVALALSPVEVSMWLLASQT